MSKLTNNQKIERLNHLIEMLGVNVRKFVTLLEFKYGTFYNYLKKDEAKRTPITNEVLSVIAEYFKIPLDYFVTDTIPMQDLKIEKERFALDKEIEIETGNQDEYKMRLFSTNVAANFETPLSENNHFEEVSVSKAIYERYAKTSLLARVQGRSMLPMIPNNAIIIITKVANWKEIEHSIVAIAYDGIFTVKKVKKNTYDDGHLFLYPLNDEFSEKKIDIKEIHEVFKVERIIDAELE